MGSSIVRIAGPSGEPRDRPDSFSGTEGGPRGRRTACASLSPLVRWRASQPDHEPSMPITIAQVRGADDTTFVVNTWPMYVHEITGFDTDFYTLDDLGRWQPDIVGDWTSP